MTSTELFDLIVDRHGVFDIACPECGKACKALFNRHRPVLRIWRSADAFLSFNCARCGWQGSVAREGGMRATVRPRTTAIMRVARSSNAERSARALALWSRARPLQGTVGETYLAGRGVTLPDEVRAAEALRFHANCPFGDKRLPAMLALMRDVGTNEPRAIHRTALKPDGSGKAAMPDGQSAKRMLGPAAGCAVKLIDDAEVTLGLGIAEGIENALTAIFAGWRPVWAAGCKGALAKFPVLSGIDALTVFSDPEPDGVKAARDCARRWQDAGAEATVIIPPGGDWNDIGRKN